MLATTMKRDWPKAYQDRLWQTVKAIEQGSQAEAVVALRPCSADYAAVPLQWGLGAAWLTFTLLMFLPTEFHNWLIYYAPMLAFALGYAIGRVPIITRLSLRPATIDKHVEIMARAIFQKGGIQHTQAKTGLLVYCSLLERRVVLLPDRGLEQALPQEEWQALRDEFDAVFSAKQPPEGLLAALEKTAAVLSRYLPVREGDFNELPDQMDIDL